MERLPVFSSYFYFRNTQSNLEYQIQNMIQQVIQTLDSMSELIFYICYFCMICLIWFSKFSDVRPSFICARALGNL